MKIVGSVLCWLCPSRLVEAVRRGTGNAASAEGSPDHARVRQARERPALMHDKSESKFVAAMAAAKWPTHYFALNFNVGQVARLVSHRL